MLASASREQSNKRRRGTFRDSCYDIGGTAEECSGLPSKHRSVDGDQEA